MDGEDGCASHKHVASQWSSFKWITTSSQRCRFRCTVLYCVSLTTTMLLTLIHYYITAPQDVSLDGATSPLFMQLPFEWKKLYFTKLLLPSPKYMISPPSIISSLFNYSTYHIFLSIQWIKICMLYKYLYSTFLDFNSVQT